MSEIYQVAIDGPSGAGKSTIAKAVARELGIDYIDTGAMYRAIGYKVKLQGVDPSDMAAVQDMLADTQIDLRQGEVFLDGENVSSQIRTPEMSMMASVCSQIPAVREKLVQLQREMGTRKSVIMDGRDIGTNVLKDAIFKIYLTASAEERARRRFLELQEKGEDQSFEDVLADIKQRDHNDMTRELNPLRKAEDAIELDSTGLDIDQVVQKVLEIVRG
ncbi:MAG: (d)CMP kinase [Firmicutes bacterium]|nr:(d)CMP kinase [Bacillota bacterium]